MSKDLVFNQKYNSLNPEQQTAVDTIDGPVLVIAGPGSGKTELLSMRVANILRLTDTPPSSILCLTFTDAAAWNMRRRLRTIIGSEANQVAIHTFHSFGTEVINQNSEYFPFNDNFKPADDLATISIMEEILSQLSITDKLSKYIPESGWLYLNNIKSRISELKKAGLSPEQFKQIILQNKQFLDQINPIFHDYFQRTPTQQANNWSNFIEQVAELPTEDTEYDYKKTLLKQMRQVSNLVHAEAKPSSKPITAWKKQRFQKDSSDQYVAKDWFNHDKYFSLAHTYEEYRQKLHSRLLYDFDDMLLEVLTAFQKNPELAYTYQEKFLYILVDEFQDTSGVQTKLLDSLINLEITNNRPNLMAVGDDDQSIFKFQGASLSHILNFKEKFADVNLITLTKNYRSKQIILDLASKVIENSALRLCREVNIDKTLVSQI